MIFKVLGFIIGAVIVSAVIEWYGDKRETQGYTRGRATGYSDGCKEGMKRSAVRGRV